MWSINVDGQVIQWFSFRIAEASHDSAEKSLTKSLRILLSHQGWTQIYWSPNIKHQEVLHIFISWKTGADLEAFTSKSAFRTMFSKLAVSPVESCYLDLKGSISPSLPTEMVSFWFPGWLTEEEKTTFVENTNAAVNSVSRRPGHKNKKGSVTTVAQGWCFPKYISPHELEERRYSEFTYVVFMAPSGLDVKPGMHKLFENAISPLDRGNGVLVEKAQYINLESRTREDLSKKCVIM